MANILIVAENFKLGGLETNILTTIKMLKENDHKIFFATQSGSDVTIIESFIEKVLILDELIPLTGGILNKTFKDIKSIILNEQISHVFIHPYVAILPAAMAARSLNKPYYIFIHSPMNLSEIYGGMYRISLQEIIMPNAKKVYGVSKEVIEYIRNLNNKIVLELFPNPIDTEIFEEIGSVKGKDFYIVSRLDSDKVVGLKEAVKYILKFHNDELRDSNIIIVGDGDSKKVLQDEIKSQYPEYPNIHFIGRSDNVAKEIQGARIVFGMGRVVLEAVSMNIPVILTGYDGLKGFVTRSNIDHFFESNFSGRNYPVISNVEIRSQYMQLSENPGSFKLRDWIETHVSMHLLGRIIHEELLSKSEVSIGGYWVDQIEKLGNACPDNLVLDMKNSQYWLSFVDFDLSSESRLSLGISSEIIKVNEENKLLSIQLGMVRQNLLDIDVYRGSELRLKEEIIEELRQHIISHEERQKINDILISSLQDNLKTSKNEIELFREKCGYLSNSNDSIMNENSLLASEVALYQDIQLRIASKINELSSTKFFKGLNLLKRFKLQFLKGNIDKKRKFIKWLNFKLTKRPYYDGEVYSPLIELYQILESRNISIPNECEQTLNKTHEESFNSEYQSKYNYYKSYLNQGLTEETKEISNQVKNRVYKGIIVYPAAVPWEPMQRPQQLLRIFSKKGYLCFFVQAANNSFDMREVDNNIFVLNQEAPLLAWLRARSCLVLCTWMLQSPFIDLLSRKVLWYDVLDRLDFLSLYDADLKAKHDQYVKEAEIVTYSAANLKEYVDTRSDAVCLPNGVNIEDFIITDQTVPKSMLKILSNNKPIIGYYGALEEWFDVKLIKEIANSNNHWDFVLIGKNNIGDNFDDCENIHLIDQVPYHDLIKHAYHFDIGIIPFKINDITNAVSPVKFFEYQALGLPVVSTSIFEMKQYKGENVGIANGTEQFTNELKKMLSKNDEKNKALIRQQAQKFQWSSYVDMVEKIIANRPELWSIYGNYQFNNTIAVMASSFLGFKGDNYYSGGAERYLIDLNHICKKMGYDFKILQYGDYSWVRRFRDIEVISLSRDGNNTSVFSMECVRKFNHSFYETVGGETRLNIYSAFFEAWPFAASPSIGISHGVAWDGPGSAYVSGMQFWENNKRFIESAKVCDTIVSVDTNTANWFQTIDYTVGNNMKVVPNYVDLEEFYPGEHFNTSRDKVIILYPRRLYAARGLYLVLDIIDEVLEKYDFAEFHFVGKGFEEDTDHVIKKKKKWGNKVQWYWLDPDEMHTVYKQADIVLIPTLYSEGTSLSCLEAMASGNAVIATRIGGLTDLIINEYNGYLIDPNSEALKQSIVRLLENKQELQKIKERAREVSNAFSKEKWKQAWEDIISKYVTKQSTEVTNQNKLITIYLASKFNISRIFDLIMHHLCSGSLIYVISDDVLQYESVSFGRIQFMPWSSEILSKPDYIICDQKSEKKVNELYGFVDKVI